MTRILHLNAHALCIQNNAINVRYFDQELFGIQQSLLENTFVFCSRTLTKSYVNAGVLTELDTEAVDSELCYYIASKEKHLSRHNIMFVEWLERLLED